MSQVVFVVQQRLVDIFFLTYLILIRLHISGCWLWLKAEMPKYHKRRLFLFLLLLLFFYFFPDPPRSWKFWNAWVFPITLSSHFLPAKVGVWNCILWRWRFTKTQWARCIFCDLPSYDVQATHGCSRAALITTRCFISTYLPCLELYKTTFNRIHCTIVVADDCT